MKIGKDKTGIVITSFLTVMHSSHFTKYCGTKQKKEVLQALLQKSNIYNVYLLQFSFMFHTCGEMP